MRGRRSFYYRLAIENKQNLKGIIDSILFEGKPGNGVVEASIIDDDGNEIPALLKYISQDPIDDFDDIVLRGRINGKEIVLAGITKGKVVLNIDFFRYEEFVLNESYLKKVRPIHTRLPFSYNIIPMPIRNIIFNAMLKMQMIRSQREIEFPAWPCERGTDFMRKKIFEAAAGVHGSGVKKIKYYGKELCVLLTHDIETRKGYGHVQRIRDFEIKRFFRSSWAVISDDFFMGKEEFSILKKLILEGCEIMSHDYRHDGKLPFMEKSEIQQRIGRIFSGQTWLRKQIRGFRSPQLMRSRALFEALEECFDYDSSVPDSEKLSPLGNSTGCATVYPYMVSEGLVEFPITIPQDFYMKNIYGYDYNGILEVWKKKTEYIESIGGLVNMITHPEMLADRKMMDVYNEYLESLSEKDAWVTTPSELLKYLRKNCHDEDKFCGSESTR